MRPLPSVSSSDAMRVGRYPADENHDNGTSKENHSKFCNAPTTTQSIHTAENSTSIWSDLQTRKNDALRWRIFTFDRPAAANASDSIWLTAAMATAEWCCYCEIAPHKKRRDIMSDDGWPSRSSNAHRGNGTTCSDLHNQAIRLLKLFSCNSIR